VRTVFDQALHWTYWGVVVVAILAFVTVWLIPVAARPSEPREEAVREAEAEAVEVS